MAPRSLCWIFRCSMKPRVKRVATRWWWYPRPPKCSGSGARAARHDGTKAGNDHRQADARCGKAPARRFRGGYVKGFDHARAQVRDILKAVAYNGKRPRDFCRRPGQVKNMRENRPRYRKHRLDPNQGHRLVEVGCVELLNRIPTGATFHAYLNPDRDMPAEAFAIHGLSIEFLKTHKRFSDVCDEFLASIGKDDCAGHSQCGFDPQIPVRRT